MMINRRQAIVGSSLQALTLRANYASSETDEPREPTIDIDRYYHQGRNENKVTIIEYINFQCPHCRKNFRDIQWLIKNHGNKFDLIIKHLTLNKSHSYAYRLAAYYESLRLQSNEHSRVFHDIILDHLKFPSGPNFGFSDNEGRKKISDKIFKQIDLAVEFSGANLKKTEIDWRSIDIEELIRNDIREAYNLGGRGTPFFWLNGDTLSGFQSYENLENYIELI